MEHTYDSAEAALRDAIKAGDAEQILALGIIVDELSPKRPPVAFGAAALWYAEQGLHVFALVAGGKIPHKGTNGCKDATTDPDTIRAWWQRWPGSNVAIATGHLVDVIDIDGLPGHISRVRETGFDASLTVLGKVSTPRPGGLHLLIPATGLGNRAGILPGIDHRGVGGYVVAPPSTISEDYARANDCTAGPYTFLGQLDLTAARAAA